MKTKVIARFHDHDGNQFNLRAAEDDSVGEIEKYDTTGRDFVYSGSVNGALAMFQDLGREFMDDLQREKLTSFLANRAPVTVPAPPVLPPDFEEEGV